MQSDGDGVDNAAKSPRNIYRNEGVAPLILKLFKNWFVNVVCKTYYDERGCEFGEN